MKQTPVHRQSLVWDAREQFPPMRYPRQYAWLLFFASMDVLFTWMILLTGGTEANWIAESVIIVYGSTGMIAFKFSLILLVIILCEWVGRQDEAKGRRFAEWVVAITVIPVVIALVLLTAGSLIGLHEALAVQYELVR